MEIQFTPNYPLTLSSTPGPYRVADYFADESEERWELIHGYAYRCPSNTVLHQAVVGELLVSLNETVKPNGGLVLHAPLDVELSEYSVVQPDLVYATNEKWRAWRDRVRGIPDLLIEVHAPDTLRRDRMLKRPLYARAGVPELWTVHPEDELIEVFVLEDGSYRVDSMDGGTFRSSTRAEVELDVDVFWAKLREQMNGLPYWRARLQGTRLGGPRASPSSST